MELRTWGQLLALAAVTVAVLGTPPAAEAQRNRPDDYGLQFQSARPGDYGPGQRNSRPHQEPAFAAGFEDGYERGLGDGRDGERYDPVRHREYRDAENGYTASYGSKDAYRNNYRAGFRQGYEEGYRDGTRYRR